MGMFDDIPIAEPPKAGGMFDDIPIAKPNSPLQNAIEPITSYPSEYEKERKGSEALMQSGYQDVANKDLTKPGWLDPLRSLVSAGKMGAGALGYISSPISAALNTVVGNPVEKISGSPFAGKMASVAGVMVGMALGMRERAAAVGGNVEILSELGKGTTVTARVPL